MRALWNFAFVGLGVLGATYAGVAPRATQQSDVKALFQARCAKCHGGEMPAGNVDLSGELTDIAGVEPIVKGRPQSSILYKLVRDGEMPKGAPKLSPDELETIRDWIMSLRPDPKRLFNTHCIGCHGGSNPAGSLDLSGNLDALAKLPQMKGATSAVLYKRLADGSMPKNGVKLKDDELSYVRDWLNSPDPDPRPLFAAKCVKCHTGATPAAGMDLSGDLASLAGLKQVVKGKPVESSVYSRIADGSMPRGGQPLSDSEVGLVWDWILSFTPHS